MRLPQGMLLAILSLLTLCSAAKKPSKAILLSKVSALTFRDGVKTTGRRVSPIPQMTCEGLGCKHYKVDVMRCKNAGSDYGDEDVQWTCTATIPEEFRLGSTDVTCEGYDSSDDPYVLKGSCGVTYKLQLTDKGKERYGTETWWGGTSKGKGSASNPDAKNMNNNTSNTGSDAIAGYLFFVLFFGVLAWIMWSIYSSWNVPAPAPRRPEYRPLGNGGWGGGGGGGGNDDDDAPPPYNPRPYNPSPKAEPSTASSTTAEPRAGWQPDFRTGLLAGAAAAYLATNRNRNARNQAPYEPPYQAPRQTGGWFGNNADPPRQTGGWFGNNAEADTSRGWGAGPSSPTRPTTRASSSSSSSFGTARHESTGFGSTSRR